jgi:PAS domain S-box-containing protein
MATSFEEVSARALLAGFPEPALVIEPDGQVIYANGAAGELLAAPLAQIVGRNIMAFLPEEERSRLNPLVWLRRWADDPQAPELQHVHLMCRDLGGGETPVRVRVGRLDSNPSSYVVMMQDISQEQARQQQTRQAHRLAARVLAISADAILNVDEQMAIIYANPSAEQLFGYPAGGLLGLSLSALLPARYRDSHAGFMYRFAREPESARLMGERAEVLGLGSSGEEIPLEASITKVTLDRSLIFSAHLRDLRPRRAAAAALAHSEAELRTVFEHAQQAMAIIRPDGTVQAMNRAARLLLPDHTNPVGQAFADLPFWSRDPDATAGALSTALSTCLGGAVYRTSTEVHLPDSTTRALDFSLWPVTSNGEVFAIIAEARDLDAGDA